MLADAITFPGSAYNVGVATEPRWLDEPEMRAWRALIRASTGLLATLDNELRQAHGLALGDYEVLARLSDAPEHALRMTDLAGDLHLSPSGITRRIDGLVKAGYVERQQCPTDRRGSYAVLTETGMKLLEEVAPTHLEGVRAHFIDRLSDRQLANLTAALTSVEVDSRAAAGGCDAATE
jgi:DNA-binding MarR family transcriptional regulator